MKNEDDTVTESDDSQYSYNSETKMPPLKYARIVGCLPRQIDSSPNCTNDIHKTSYIENEISCSTLGTLSIPDSEYVQVPIVAIGHANGSICLMDTKGESVLFGSTLADGGLWYINPKKQRKVVDVAFDSGCGTLAAVNDEGDVVIFEPLVWSAREEQDKGLFSFGQAVDTSYNNETPGRQSSQIVLNKPPMNTIRFSYDHPPSCMVLDPSYSRNKREHSLVMGFNDGRLILSKLQMAKTSGISSFFGGGGARKVDTVIYQGIHRIETVVWRASLLAWADESGVRLFDIETMSRIAHVDRPSGARESLYPTVGTLHPCLMFERSDRLLVGWGDCLMGMRIYGSEIQNNDGGGKDIRKKIVECTMAWELDCVACGVVPVDVNHVAVLGLVPCPLDEDGVAACKNEEYSGNGSSSIAGGDNMLELQIINRENGKSISNDIVPMLERANDPNNLTLSKPNACDFKLLSSYATQRMEDIAEWDALDNGEKETVRNEVDVDKFMSNQTFPDAHLRWNMDKDVCTTEFSMENGIIPTVLSGEEDEQSTSSEHSILSDDYVFPLSEPTKDILLDPVVPSRSKPPTMIITYRHDACLIQTRDADDAISFARSLRKPAVALKAALVHRRDVRRHRIDMLVDEYFVALLRMQSNSNAALSFPRLQIASQSIPILLGGDARMWQRWIFLFAKVSGGLFTIREKIPVRDPWLPPFVFEMALEKMLQETCISFIPLPSECKVKPSRDYASEKMFDLFLETLRAWGPTSSLRRRIQMHRYFIQSHRCFEQSSNKNCMVSFIRQAERDLQRRITQTAFGVLTDRQSVDGEATHPSIRQYISSSDDSLFSVENMMLKLNAKLRANDEEGKTDANFSSSMVKISKTGQENIIVLESLAELELMRERYDRALGYYLVIGSGFSEKNLLSTIESAAVESVNSYTRCRNISLSHRNSLDENDQSKFGHVLPLIELHQLHHFLLQQNYSLISETDDSNDCSPIVSLIKLVGLEKVGEFLLESCSPPEDVTRVSTDKKILHHANLPLDLVADQLKSRPKLQYWYLFLLFVHKPEMYIKFATTAVPSTVIMDLHRVHFSLFVDYSDSTKYDEAKSTHSFLDVDEETPFMSFLMAALPHGGIRAESVIEALEHHRGGKIDSPIYARELAFIIERFGSGDEEDSKKVLQIYLLGAKDLFLAVAFAERNSKQSNMLWEILIKHCTEAEGQCALFGSLLEAAAHCGADLSTLVAKIPEGMAIEGLRPKLIAAVTDYRYKVKIHEFESNILTDDKISIIRQLIYLSRRGSRNIPRTSKCDVTKGGQKQRHCTKRLLQLQRDKMAMISIPSHLSNFHSNAIR